MHLQCILSVEFLRLQQCAVYFLVQYTLSGCGEIEGDLMWSGGAGWVGVGWSGVEWGWGGWGGVWWDDTYVLIKMNNECGVALPFCRLTCSLPPDAERLNDCRVVPDHRPPLTNIVKYNPQISGHDRSAALLLVVLLYPSNLVHIFLRHVVQCVLLQP